MNDYKILSQFLFPGPFQSSLATKPFSCTLPSLSVRYFQPRLGSFLKSLYITARLKNPVTESCQK